MSDYYKPHRTYGLYKPTQKTLFKLSRSKIDLFLECPRCFYLDRRQGVARPPGYPFSLNSAVDALLKKEFDVHRANKTPHPLMSEAGLSAVPFAHTDIDTWRENFVGVQVPHAQSGFLVFGAVDDVWVKTKEVKSASEQEGELIVVDYKATSKDGTVSLDAEWQIGYKRQMEVYQWLLRGQGFSVSDTGYFVYANGRKDTDGFNARLTFDISLLPYTGNADWVEGALMGARECLQSDVLPKAGADCDYCAYRRAVSMVTDEPHSSRTHQKSSTSEKKGTMKRTASTSAPHSRRTLFG
jgi:hypothetical protein